MKYLNLSHVSVLNPTLALANLVFKSLRKQLKYRHNQALIKIKPIACLFFKGALPNELTINVSQNKSKNLLSLLLEKFAIILLASLAGGIMKSCS